MFFIRIQKSSEQEERKTQFDKITRLISIIEFCLSQTGKKKSYIEFFQSLIEQNQAVSQFLGITVFRKLIHKRLVNSFRAQTKMESAEMIPQNPNNIRK